MRQKEKEGLNLKAQTPTVLDMSQNAQILLEGSYLYFEKEHNYSQEDFKLLSLPDQQCFQFYSEILTRMETGEFLKILVKYEMNQQFYPIFSQVEKSIGSRYAVESMKIDMQKQELLYTFQTSQGSQEFKRPVNSKHYLASPAVCTAAVSSLTRKFDATERTAITLLSSENEWSYSKPPTEKILYAEFKTRDLDFKLHGNSLSASHLCLYEHDTEAGVTEIPADLYLSKHYNVPYQVTHGDLRYVIKSLKKNS